MKLLNIRQGYLSRNMNEGFQVERKRNEIFSNDNAKSKVINSDETDSV